jgi:surface protein
MFSGCNKLELIGLNKFDTSKVTDMSYMFNYMDNMINFDLSNFNTENVNQMENMFSSIYNLEI